jgi:serine protease Do
MKKKILSFIVIVLILSVTFVGGSVLTYYVFLPEKEDALKEEYNVKISEDGIVEPVKRIYDAVVLIETYKGAQVVSSGTGFVYKVDNMKGYIITNEHVISNGSKVHVTFYNGNEVEAEVLGSDIFADIAILAVDKKHVLKVANLGSSKDIEIGETVFTVGTPIGREYMGTVTRGIISGKNRMLAVGVGGSASEDWIVEVIQTDAAINPGNSGGPLVNMNGEVIGINSLKFVKQEIEGMGFAIPIEYAMTHVDTLEKGKTIPRPLLGVQLLDVTDTYALYRYGINIDPSVTSGAVVETVLSDTPAARSKLQRGDVILKIGDVDLKNKAYLRYILYKYKVGDTIKVTYYRNKKIMTVDVLLTDTFSEDN